MPSGARMRLARKFARAQPCQVETRHHVRDQHHIIAIDVADALRAIGGVGNREQRIGMGMIDVRVRQDRMQDRLDRGRGRAGAHHVGRELADHLRIG